VSCYFRHLSELFAEAGIRVTQENRKDLDRLLHELVDVEYKNCPSAGRGIKALQADDKKRQKLIRDLKARWKS